MPPDNALDAWVLTNLGVDPASYVKKQAAPNPTGPDPTAGLMPPPSDFATYPDDMKEMWAKVKSGDAKAREDWKNIMGTPESARQNAAGRARTTAELAQAKQDETLGSGLGAVLKAVSPAVGAVFNEIGGLETIKELAKTDWKKEWDDTALAVGGAVQKRVDSLAEGLVSVQEGIAAAPGKIKDAVGKGVDKLADAAVALPDQIKALATEASNLDADKVMSALDKAGHAAVDKVTDIATAIDKTTTDLGQKVDAVMDKALDTAAKIADDPEAALKAAGTAIAGAAKSTGDALRKADKDFWRGDAKALRETLADASVEAASQAAQAVAFEGVAKGIGAGFKAVRGGEVAADVAKAGQAGAKIVKGVEAVRGAEVVKGAETVGAEALGTAGRTAGKVEQVATEAKGTVAKAGEALHKPPESGFGMHPDPKPSEFGMHPDPKASEFGMSPDPAASRPVAHPDAMASDFGRSPDPAHSNLPTGEKPPVDVAGEEVPAEKRHKPSNDQGGSYATEDALADEPDDAAPTSRLGKGKFNTLHEAQGKIEGARNQLKDIARASEKVAGGKAEAVESAFKQYQEGLKKATEGLKDSVLRSHLSPEELAEMEAYLRPDAVQTLDDFRNIAGLGAESTPGLADTVRMPGPGTPGLADTVRMPGPATPGLADTVHLPPPGEQGLADTVRMPQPGEKPPVGTQRFAEPEFDGGKTQTLSKVEFPPEINTALAEKAEATAARIAEQEPAALKKLSATRKQDLVKELVGGGRPRGKELKALKKLYEAMELDPEFVAQEEQRMAKVGEAFKGDAQLKQARDQWSQMKPEDKVKQLKRLIAEQSKQYGIEAPEIELINVPEGKDGKIVNGYFNQTTGKISLNVDSSAALKDFEKALDVAAHENAHNYQMKLAARLKPPPSLFPGDKEFEQAVMFAANGEPGAKIVADLVESSLEDYMAQPKEAHSFTVGPKLAKIISDGL